MTYARQQQQGFTLVELMVAVALFSIMAVSFYAVMFSGVRGADATQSGVDVSAEARLGLNRLIRDVREATTLAEPLTDSAFTIHVDFSRDGTIQADEIETFAVVGNTITLEVDGDEEVLIEGVGAVGTEDVFSYSSNDLEFDHDPRDGIATCLEIDDPPIGVSGGDGDTCDGGEVDFLTNVDFSFSVTSGEGDSLRTEDFFGQAQLRNRR